MLAHQLTVVVAVHGVAVGTAIARRPRTDPSERNYRTGLSPWVMTLNRTSGSGCRMRADGSQ
jgi:hypothetical protein